MKNIWLIILLLSALCVHAQKKNLKPIEGTKITWMNWDETDLKTFALPGEKCILYQQCTDKTPPKVTGKVGFRNVKFPHFEAIEMVIDLSDSLSLLKIVRCEKENCTALLKQAVEDFGEWADKKENDTGTLYSWKKEKKPSGNLHKEYLLSKNGKKAEFKIWIESKGN